jgi:catechol 2,3-dioxygenase-like lactoylglutathione lyase family enzyme
MTVTKVLAVVPVDDLEAATEWYERLLGRPPDARPMESLADWHLLESAWVSVFHDSDHAGETFLNFAVDDLPAHTAWLATRDIVLDEAYANGKGATLASVTDPAGNTITFIENPSV